MHLKPVLLRLLSVLMVAALACLAACGDNNGSVAAPEGPTPALTHVGDLAVIRLKGDPYERGYTLGVVAGARIVAMYQGYILDWALGLSPEYSTMFRIMKNLACGLFVMTDEEREELRGITDGMHSIGIETIRLPDGSLLELNENDLCIANVVADFAQIACSSVSAWGEMTPDGETLIARNLDWDPGPDRMLGPETTVISETPEDESWRFVSIGWPGLIGCYSCINGDGQAAFIHDTHRFHDGFRVRVEPRTFVLRRAMLAAQGTPDPFDTMEAVLETGKWDTGNNFHVVVPAADVEVPAACMEVDDNKTHPDGSVTVRTSRDVAVNGTDLTEAFFVTNHHRKRYPAETCSRYERMVDTVESRFAAQDPTPMEMSDLVSIMGEVEFEQMSVYTVAFKPADRILEIHRSNADHPPSGDPGVHVPWDVLFPW